MIDFLYDVYQSGQIAAANATATQAQDRVGRLVDELAFLRKRLDRMVLVNAAMWELLKEKAGMIDAELQAKVLELDAADGQIDGRLGSGKRACANCGKSLHPKHAHCLYCGHQHPAANAHAAI
jgi:hypothetical protein